MFNMLMLLVEKMPTDAPAAPAGTPQGPGFGSLLMFGVIFLFMYIIMIIPQQKKAKKEQEMRNRVKEGDRILTAGGIIGTVKKVRDNSVIIESVKNGAEFEVLKTSISQNIDELAAAEKAKESKEKK